MHWIILIGDKLLLLVQKKWKRGAAHNESMIDTPIWQLLESGCNDDLLLAEPERRIVNVCVSWVR